MHIVITGGTGFIGGALIAALHARGDRVTVLTRRSLAGGPRLRYVNALEAIDPEERVDAVVNLAGESLAAQRWSPAFKQVLRDSRLGTTQAVAALVGRQRERPGTVLSASAIGFYGPHGDAPLTELSAPNDGFSHRLCRDWEAAAAAAATAETRVLCLRLGVVLAAQGGSFGQLRAPFRLGVAAWMGSGQQWLSWVHRDDVIAAMLFLLDTAGLDGAFNVTAPAAVTSRDFAAVMARAHRIWLHAGVPAPLLRLALGEMADALLLTGQRVSPARLEAAGFQFRFPDLATALPTLLA
jgi:uncharacterized protein